MTFESNVKLDAAKKKNTRRSVVEYIRFIDYTNVLMRLPIVFFFFFQQKLIERISNERKCIIAV